LDLLKIYVGNDYFKSSVEYVCSSVPPVGNMSLRIVAKTFDEESWIFQVWNYSSYSFVTKYSFTSIYLTDVNISVNRDSFVNDTELKCRFSNVIDNDFSKSNLSLDAILLHYDNYTAGNVTIIIEDVPTDYGYIILCGIIVLIISVIMISLFIRRK
jgi:hypothetical protein